MVWIVGYAGVMRPWLPHLSAKCGSQFRNIHPSSRTGGVMGPVGVKLIPDLVNRRSQTPFRTD